uniref:Uncharacterized protein n=1 Tax=Trichogramma kaykai TaxID=54128 RepID=A0ABD2WWX9_9HYME
MEEDTTCINCTKLKHLEKMRFFFRENACCLHQNILMVQNQENGAFEYLIDLMQNVYQDPHLSEHQVFCLLYNVDNKFQLIKKMQKNGFHSYFASVLALLMNNEIFVRHITDLDSPENVSELDHFKNPKQKLKHLTENQTLMSKLKTKIMFHVARKLNCKIILLDNLLEDTSTQIINNTVLGIGIANMLPKQRKLKNSTVKVYSPLHIMTVEEKNVLITKDNCKNSNLYLRKSLMDMTKEFLDTLHLHSSFKCAVVSNISDKLSISPNRWIDSFCSFCFRKIQVDNSSNGNATQVAKFLTQYLSNVQPRDNILFGAMKLCDISKQVILNFNKNSKIIKSGQINLTCDNHVQKLCYTCCSIFLVAHVKNCTIGLFPSKLLEII